MDYVRKRYGVPAKRGGQVEYTSQLDGERMRGTICGASGGRLHIRFGDNKRTFSFHPTWQLDYLDDAGNVIWRST